MLTLISLTVIIGTFFVTFWIVGFWNGKRKSGCGRRLPPSLPSLPIVGSLPFMKEFDALPEYLTKIAHKLGPVFSLRFGSRYVVVLNSRESIEDALVRHSSSFSGREFFYTEKYGLNRNRKGMVFRNYDDEFKRYHKLTLSILKDFGFGSRSQLETRTLIEIDELVKHIRKSNGEAFNPQEIITISTSNVPINILVGRRRDYKYEKTLKAIDKDIDLVLDDVERDCFVRRYIEKEGPNYDREQLKYMLRDFYGGSVDTTSTTILWFFIYIANNPQIEDRIQKEIDSVVPRDRLPTIDDQPMLPYVEATILELLRHKAPLPMAFPHLTLHDTEVLGYFIPADTVVLVNIKGAHMNRTDWPDSDVFRPERFLDENKKLINRNSVIAFSLGRRSCPGEALARQQLFLFISGLMQNFHVRPPEDVESITVKTIYSITEVPSPFKIRMIARNG